MPMAPNTMTAGIDQINHGSIPLGCRPAFPAGRDVASPREGLADSDGDGVGFGGCMRRTSAAGMATSRTGELAPSLLSRILRPGPTEMPSP